ncbi:hypothetical protein P8452_30784 [Trifolium repens]|nr:hypothetical protein P8452_30784 [Trifolium repens]
MFCFFDYIHVFKSLIEGWVSSLEKVEKQSTKGGWVSFNCNLVPKSKSLVMPLLLLRNSSTKFLLRDLH